MIINGRYAKGGGKAHLSSVGHEPIFGHPMIGTFNVRTSKKITDFVPSIVSTEYGRKYWHLKINGVYEAWAFRWEGSKMPLTTWELVSKERLPDSLKHRTIEIEISGEVSKEAR